MVTNSSSASTSSEDQSSFDTKEYPGNGNGSEILPTHGSLIVYSEAFLQKTKTEKPDLHATIAKIEKEKISLAGRVEKINEELDEANNEKATLKARVIEMQQALEKSKEKGFFFGLVLAAVAIAISFFSTGVEYKTFSPTSLLLSSQPPPGLVCLEQKDDHGPTVYVGCGKVGTGSDSLRPGNIIALHNSCHNRFLRVMNEEVDGYGGIKDITELPSDWMSERLTVVDGGDGEIALYSEHHRRFIRLDNKYDVNTGGGEIAMNDLPSASKWPSERFVVLPAGEGKVSLFSRTHRLLMRMDSDGKVDGKGDYLEPCDLPFTVLVLKDCYNDSLIPGSLVALHYPEHNRFLRLNDGQVDGKGGPADWKLERFRVVDAGEGTIALYNLYHRRFVVRENGILSASSAAVAVTSVQDLIDTGAHVRFLAEELGEGKIYLIPFYWYKATVAMDHEGNVYTSREPMREPMIFKVLHLK